MGLNLSKYLLFFQETSPKVENSNLLTLRYCHDKFSSILNSVKILSEDSLDTKFCAKLEK